jgi:hypothetical protein
MFYDTSYNKEDKAQVEDMQYAICNMQYAICNMQYAKIFFTKSLTFLLHSNESMKFFNNQKIYINIIHLMDDQNSLIPSQASILSIVPTRKEDDNAYLAHINKVRVFLLM